MRVSVLAIQKARFCALVLDESLISCDVVSESFGTRLEYLAKINGRYVRLIDDYVGSVHDIKVL